MVLDDFRESVRNHIGIIGLECEQIRWADAIAVKKEPRHELFRTWQAIRNNSQTLRVVKTQRSKRPEATPRSFRVDRGAEEGHPGFVHAGRANGLSVAYHGFLSKRP